ncbi:unnamed protein product [Pleuronectes platessa]|uniref:Uncharacterized protein n=1 Tax=Pleuronectes platessa TaxID=8262 RepID=A0A9N7Z5I6_PLEPL|nr:unnamed protein product [Pleuronectes platessa]
MLEECLTPSVKHGGDNVMVKTFREQKITGVGLRYLDDAGLQGIGDDDIDTYTDAVICYISKCIDDVVPRITVTKNSKPEALDKW